MTCLPRKPEFSIGQTWILSDQNKRLSACLQTNKTVYTRYYQFRDVAQTHRDWQYARALSEHPACVRLNQKFSGPACVVLQALGYFRAGSRDGNCFSQYICATVDQIPRKHHPIRLASQSYVSRSSKATAYDSALLLFVCIGVRQRYAESGQ